MTGQAITTAYWQNPDTAIACRRYGISERLRQQLGCLSVMHPALQRLRSTGPTEMRMSCGAIPRDRENARPPFRRLALGYRPRVVALSALRNEYCLPER